MNEIFGDKRLVVGLCCFGSGLIVLLVALMVSLSGQAVSSNESVEVTQVVDANNPEVEKIKISEVRSVAEQWKSMSLEEWQAVCGKAIDQWPDCEIAPDERMVMVNHMIDGTTASKSNDLDYFCSLVMMAHFDLPLGKFGARGNDQTKPFLVGVRRRVPIMWESEDENFRFSLYDASSGRIVEPSVVMQQRGGMRSLWIDPGMYYLDVQAVGRWDIALFRSQKQLERLVSEMPDDLFKPGG